MFFQWHASRGSTCLADLFGGFRGIHQCDGYASYGTHAARKPGVTLPACWAHGRRKFHEALQTGQKPATGPLKAIATLYGTVKELWQSRGGPEERPKVRQHDTAPLLQFLRDDLIQLRDLPSVSNPFQRS